jgi:hypothetical protein
MAEFLLAQSFELKNPKPLFSRLGSYLTKHFYYKVAFMAACAETNLAIGTRYGEQLT